MCVCVWGGGGGGGKGGDCIDRCIILHSLQTEILTIHFPKVS